MTPMRGPRCLLLSLLLLGGMLLTPRPARAGGVEPCEYASVFPGAALNVLVLPYRYEAPRGGDGGVAVAVPPELELASRQLAALVHLETLMSLLKYGSVGAKNLLAEPSQLCDVERVLARIGRPGESGGAPAPGALRGGQAVLLLWGRLFEQGGQLYLQSYLRFARQGPQGLADERLGFELGPGLPRLEAGLPVQALAFAPRRIGRQELARVDRDFRQAMLLRKEPRADAPGRSIDFSPHEAFAYWITAARGDWMQLQPMAGGPAGWVQVRGEATPDWSLQRWLPELAYVDAVAGFMRLRTSQQPVTVAERQRMLRAIETGLARYEQALAAELAPQPWGLAAALRGWLAWERRERRSEERRVGKEC